MEEILKEINIMKMDVVVLTKQNKKHTQKKQKQEVKNWEITYTFSAG